MYRLQLQARAIQDLSALDKNAARRIVSRLNWPAENIASVRREFLAGELSDYCKFRVGDFLYQAFDDRQVIVVHRIGHRREIYRGK